MPRFEHLILLLSNCMDGRYQHAGEAGRSVVKDCVSVHSHRPKAEKDAGRRVLTGEDKKESSLPSPSSSLKIGT